VFYVWFDAPIEYIACAQEMGRRGKRHRLERWWRTDKRRGRRALYQFNGQMTTSAFTRSAFRRRLWFRKSRGSL